MRSILVLMILSTACGKSEEKDKDGAPPRLVSLSVDHVVDADAQEYSLIVEGRVSSETVDQFIAYEIALAASEDAEPENCTHGDITKTFYQQEKLKVFPDSIYYIKACSLNKEDGSISPELIKVVETGPMPEAEGPEDLMPEEDDRAGKSICELEPNHMLCTEGASVCDDDPTLCEPQEVVE